MRKAKYLVTYDIADNRIRNKLSKFLLQFGVRVQLSCFEIECGEKELKAVVSFIEKNIDKSSDSVFLFPISRNMENSIVEIGVGREIRRVL